MGKRDYYKSGDHNAICDRCGQKFKGSECKVEEWDNLFVCEECWEPRHPQDFVRGIKEEIKVPIPRLRGPIRYIN